MIQFPQESINEMTYLFFQENNDIPVKQSVNKNFKYISSRSFLLNNL